jgi:hypothetical protein
MFITNELKAKAEEALTNANGVDKVSFGGQVLLKLGSTEQLKTSGERMPLGSFKSGKDEYILYNA